MNDVFYRFLLAFFYVGSIACTAYEVQWLSKPFTVTGQSSVSTYKFELASIVLMLFPLLLALLYLAMICTAWSEPWDYSDRDFCCCTDDCCTRSSRRHINYMVLGWIAVTNGVVLVMQGVRYTLHDGPQLSPLCKDIFLVDPTCHTAKIFLAVTAGAVLLSLCGLALVYFQKRTRALNFSRRVADLERPVRAQQPRSSQQMTPLLSHSRRSSEAFLLQPVKVGQPRPFNSEPLDRIP